MTNKRLTEIRKEVYNQAYGFDGSYGLPAGYDKMLDLYDTKKALQEFFEQPITYFSYDKPVKKAKEIALETALKIVADINAFNVRFGTAKPAEEEELLILKVAKKIFQWLTETETDKR